jgi:hypothetical protein
MVLSNVDLSFQQVPIPNPAEAISAVSRCGDGTRLTSRRPKIPDFLPCRFTASLHVWVYLSANQKTEIKQVEELSVKSKIIKTVYFSQEDGRLRICFKNGEERLFEGVPSSEAHAMTAAPSPGHYYLDRIRTRFRRLAA